MANPLAPLLTSPRQLQHMASGGTIRLYWQYQHPEAGKTQAKVAVRRKELPSGSYEYWTGAAWTGVETYVVCTTEYIDITTGWTTNKKYQWSVSCQDSVAANSPYASGLILISIDAPTVTITQPTATPSVSRPTIAWVYTQTQGYQQLRYRVAVYTAAQYGAGGFSPFVSDSEWETGWVTSSTDWSVECGVDVSSGVSYKAYVQVETEGALQSSATASSVFTPSLALPPAPSVTVTVDNDLGAFKIDIAASLNLVSNAGSSFEDETVGEWLELVGCTLETSADFASHGVNSMKVTSRGATYAYMSSTYATYAAWTSAQALYSTAIATLEEAATMRITTPTATSGFAVVAGQVYSAVAQVRKATGSANAVARFAWYDGAGTFLSYSATETVTANATGWTTIAMNSRTAPVGAAFAALQIAFTIAGVGEVFYVDQIAVANAASTIWSPGSGASASFIVERSDDEGETWTPVLGYSRLAPGDSHHPVQALVSDYDRTARIGYHIKPQYRAYTITSGGAVSSVGTATATDFLVGNGWWLRDPLDPTRDVKLRQMDFSGQFEIAGDTYHPEGRDAAVVIHANTAIADSFDINTWTYTTEELDALRVLLESRRTLFVQSMTSGHGWYVRVNGSCVYEQTMARGNGQSTIYKPLFRVRAPMVEVQPIYVQAIPDTADGSLTYEQVSV